MLTTQIVYALLSVVAVSLVSLIGLAAISINEKKLHNFIFLLVALAIGALLGDAFIHLIPEAFEGTLGPDFAPFLIIAGILVFFALEKIFSWHHIHTTAEHSGHLLIDEAAKIKPIGYLILTSDAFHNFIDGVIIGAGYLVSVEVGIATTLAIILHEIPQEIGDFGILLHAGFSKAKALLFNFFSALSAILGAIFSLILGANDEFLGWALPIAAGAFIYIAVADLVPELHKQRGRRAYLEVLTILIGVLGVYLIKFIEA